MEMLFTASALICALLACACAALARKDRDTAERAAARLRGMIGRLIALEGAQESTQHALRKLTGQFHAVKRDLEPREPEANADPELDLRPALNRAALEGVDVCVNWVAAKLEGPGSQPSLCSCAYCERQRESRRQLRAVLVPKSQSARIEAIKRGLES